MIWSIPWAWSLEAAEISPTSSGRFPVLLGQLGKSVLGGSDQFGAQVDAGYCFFDQVGGVVGRVRRSLGQAPDFIRHHGKPRAGLAGPGRLHRGVQGQQIGLESNFVNGLDDFFDLLTGQGNLRHGLAHLVHGMTGFWPPRTWFRSSGR